MIATNLATPKGVPPEAWLKLAKDAGSRWKIVERDSDGSVIGTAYRNADGSKDFATGGKRGLIYCDPLDPYAGSSQDDPIFVCEGASDTASLLGLNMDAVGIPMAGQGGDSLAALLNNRHAVVVRDNDAAGVKGTARIVEALLPFCASVRVIVPPSGAKDVREAVIAGAEADDFVSAAKAAIFRQKPVPKSDEMEPFPLDALPPVVAEYVKHSADALDVNPAAVAIPVLSALAGTIGRSRSAHVWGIWVEPCIIWTMVSMPSGTGKTHAMRAAFGYLDSVQSYEFQRFDRETQEVEKQPKKKSTIVSDDADSVADEIAPIPPKRLIVSDITTEALAVVLKNNPRGVTAKYDEGAAWIGGFDKYRSNGSQADRSFWLEAFDGGTWTSDRKTTGTTHVPYLGVSVSAAIQPRILADCICKGDEESGLLPRILVAEPPTPHSYHHERATPPEVEQAWVETLQQLLELQPETLGDGPTPKKVPMSPGAKEAWIQFKNESIDRRLETPSDAENTRWPKWIGYSARIALVFELATRAGENKHPDDPFQASIEPEAGSVRVECMKSAITVVNWFADEHSRISGRVQGRTDNIAELIDLITASGGSLTVRELHKKKQTKYPNSASARGALNVLVKKGLGEWAAPTRGVEPTHFSLS